MRTFRIRVCVLIGCGPIAKEPMARPTEERRCWQRAKEAFWILRPDPPTHTTPPHTTPTPAAVKVLPHLGPCRNSTWGDRTCLNMKAWDRNPPGASLDAPQGGWENVL